MAQGAFGWWGGPDPVPSVPQALSSTARTRLEGNSPGSAQEAGTEAIPLLLPWPPLQVGSVGYTPGRHWLCIQSNVLTKTENEHVLPQSQITDL